MDFKVNYLGTTEYEIHLYGGFNEYRVSTGSIIANLEEAINDAKELMQYHRFMNADIIDATTGEIVATVEGINPVCERCRDCSYLMEKDGVPYCDCYEKPANDIERCLEYNDDNGDDIFEGFGYNPYLGCYDFDC